MSKDKKVIGRWDRIDLPEMELEDIHAKVDTGAYTSSIHCSVIELVERDGKEVLHFILLDPEHPAYNGKAFFFKEYKTKHIKNSFGTSEERYIIQTKTVLFGEEKQTEFSLSYRGNLKNPILLGRKFLKPDYLVDINRKELSYRLKQEEKL